MSPLTDETHKSLLPIGGRPTMQHALDRILAADVDDVVCVTGYRNGDVEAFLHATYGRRVNVIHNDRYMDDVNILSVELGVSALKSAERGYLIVETDLLMDDAAWGAALDGSTDSYWVTSGVFSPRLTGGALKANPDDTVAAIAYSPTYDRAFDGWRKLVGILHVGAGQVRLDGMLRRKAIDRTISQYYMMPWVENLLLLPCKARDVGASGAMSFNDVAAYREAELKFGRVREQEREHVAI
jgi:hypothetical protein